MKDYLNIFINDNYPMFIDKYLKTKTLDRLKYVSQFCGCDYTKLYSPLFMYTRYDHSMVVSLMTWHFTHDKKETIVALLHDVGTPCFAHCVDYVLGDYLKQESSEKKIIDIIVKDRELLSYLEEDDIALEDIRDLSKYKILDNKIPRLCTDRLDGVLHSCYIWLKTNTIEDIKEVYNNLILLTNEDNNLEIGFKDIKVANKFSKMVYKYATEFQSNNDKYVMKYISELIRLAIDRKLISLEDLYTMKESEICNIFDNNFNTWKYFKNIKYLINSNNLPNNTFYISFDTKRRYVIPLVRINNKNIRLDKIYKDIYDKLYNYSSYKYCYAPEINELD